MEVSAESQSAIRDDIELARAITAVILAVKLDRSEEKAQEAYNTILNMSSAASNS